MYNNQTSFYENKQIRRGVNKVSLGVFLYNIFINILAIVYMIGFMFAGIIKAQDGALESQILHKMEQQLVNNGILYILCIGISLLFIMLYFRYNNIKCLKINASKKMTVSKFVPILCVFMGAQFIFSMFSMGLERVFNNFGYTIMEQIESASSTSTTISMFLYASILGPIVEEIVYRGFVMNALKKYGTVFAIVVSSVLFGIMHANLAQNIFAFVVGLVLAYTAMEYGLKWSILLHIINNCIFGDIFGKLIANLTETMQLIASYGMQIGFLVAAIIVLCVKRKYIKAYIVNNKPTKKSYRYAVTAIWFIIFIIMQTLLSFIGIEKI